MMLYQSFLLVSLCLFGFTIASPLNFNQTTISVKEDVSYRLPDDVVPTYYAIDLLIESNFPETEAFKVLKTEITLSVRKATKSFSLHYALPAILNAGNMILRDTKSPPNYPLFKSSLNPLNQQLTITLVDDAELEVGIENYILGFYDLTGDLQKDMYGFYLSQYENKEGDIIFAAGTQFQPTHARKAFPCFDEPIFKAEFELSIIYPKEYEATISNTVGEDEHDSNPTMTKRQFAKTPRMSSYLIAFVVSKFEAKSTLLQSKSTFEEVIIPHNYVIFYPEGFGDATKYSLSITEPIIAAMEYKSGVKYDDMGIPNLYQVAMPDFSAGAMENWGLAIYRERGLLWTPEDSSNRQKQYVCSIIAHEISHMWFGDYVTTNWWSTAWLNEGFATFFEAQATAMVEPTWKMMDQFVVDDLQAIMQSDAIFGSWPLSSKPENVITAGQISTKFSGITYSKGGSVIRMMQHFIGESKFYAALKFYMNENKLKNTLPSNLWRAFDSQNLLTLPAQVGMEVVMSSWTEKPGFPVLTVKKSGNNVVISQSRFLLTADEDATKWYVPITYATSKINYKFEETAVQAWLLPTADLTIPNVFIDNNWIIVNVQETGYYRVDYDAELWTQIRDILRSDRFLYIHEVNRAQIIDDVMNLARVQTNKYETALDITKYLEQETYYLPWFSAFNSFSYLRKRIARTDEVSVLLDQYIQKMSNKLYNSVDFKTTLDQGHLEVFRTVLALQWACELGIQDCIDKSKTAFANYKDRGNKVDPNLRSIVYCNAIRQDDQTDWNFLWNEFSGFKMSTEKVTIISALGCASNKDILNNYLTKSITANSGIKSQDALSVFTAVLNGNPSNVDVALDFVINKFEDISIHYGGMRSLTRIIDGIADRITVTAQVTKFKKFIEDNREKLQDAAEAADAAIINAEVNIIWFNNYRSTVLDWLKRERETGGTATVTLSLSATLVSLLLYFLQ